MGDWKEKEAVKTPPFVAQLKLLEQRYTLRERSHVLQLLEKGPHLISLLLQTHNNIKAHFPQAQLSLQVVTDPEALEDDVPEVGNSDEDLVVFITTHLSPSEAVAKLKQFYKSWWLDASRSTKETVCFNLECL